MMVFTQAGDILLFHGNDPVDLAIQAITGSQYNHAAIIGPDGKIVEAWTDGVFSHTPAESFADSTLQYVDVRRAISLNPQQLESVSVKAATYEGDAYGYLDIGFLAFLCLTRRLPNGFVVDSLLENVDGAIANMVQLGKKHVICSALVALSFSDSGFPVISMDGARLDSEFVTPYDLEHSPMFVPIGRIYP